MGRTLNPHLPFQQLGKYRIVARIGQGGMGDVYRAIDESLDRPVAIKVLPPELTRSAAFVQRFKAEAMAAAQISHANIVPIYSIGEDEGHHYFAMQLIQGSSLQDYLAQGQRFNLQAALAIIKQCLSGLEAAHGRGLVHRDVKPGNVLLDASTGHAMLVDFGLVRVLKTATRITASGMVMGTVDYIAPEQARGHDVDGRADLYSLGVLAYELLAGRLPFDADSPTAMVFQHVYEEPLPLWEAAPDTPRTVVDIVERMMAKDPVQRYPTASAALSDIRAYENGDPVSRVTATTWVGRTSFLSEAPDIGEDADPTPSTARWVQPKWWQDLQTLALALFHARAPVYLQELQTTEHDVNGVVGEYQRRHDQIARLLQQAEDAAASLCDRKQSYLRAIETAERRTDSEFDEDGKRRIQHELQYCRQAAGEIDEQVRRFLEDIADLRLRKAQANAKLLALVSQRDLLQARLKAARARGAWGAIGTRRQWRVRLLTVGGCLIAVAAALRLFGKWSPDEERDDPLARLPAATISPAAAPAPLAGSESAIDPPLVNLPRQVDFTERQRIAALDLKSTTLRFGGDGVEFDLYGLNTEWLSAPFYARVVALIEPASAPVQLLGNLDPRLRAAAQPGWALFVFPSDVKDDRPDTVVLAEKEMGIAAHRFWSGQQANHSRNSMRLAFAYTDTGGRVRRIIGPAVDAALWWLVEVERRSDSRVQLRLGKREYLEAAVDDMLLAPTTRSFWLGAPPFAEATFRGEIGGFTLRGLHNGTGVSHDVLLSADFTTPRDDLLIDGSAWGHHGKLSPGGPEWQHAPERMMPVTVDWSPPPGKSFAVQIGSHAAVELLRTQDLFALDTEFTCEMWFRIRSPFYRQVVILDNARPPDPSTPLRHPTGWSLTLTNRNEKQAFQLHFPGGGETAAAFESAEFPWKFRWHHLAFCNTLTGRQIYVDGAPLISDERQQSKVILDHRVSSRANLSLGKRQPWDLAPNSNDGDLQIRSFRLSAGRRYLQSFDPPETFTRDQETLILLDVAHQSGQVIQDLSGKRHEGLILGAQWITIGKPEERQREE